MTTGTKLEKPEPVLTGLKSELISELVKHDVVPAKAGKPSYSTSSGNAKINPKSEVNGSSIKGAADQVPAGENGVYNPPTSSYSYYYPAGYNGSFTQLDDHGYFQVDGSHMGMQSENGSLLYYLPGYNPYTGGQVVGADGQNVGQQQYFSSGYLPQPVSYGSEALPCYSWDSTYVGDVSNGNMASKNGKYVSASGYPKSNGFSSIKSNNSNNGVKSWKSAQSARPLNKVSNLPGSDFSGGHMKGYNNNVGNFSFQKQGSFSQNSPTNYRQNGRMWYGNDRNRTRERFHKNNDFETSSELTCGPRASNKIAPSESPVKEDLGIAAVSRDQYNQPDFETVYTNAKFYVIKSYNEDDIHKSIKYDVWSSTPNGNKKLDAAFRDAGQKSTESGTKCPIFLFFSVNGSGQFVGLAEMVGQVDFNKDMDFWQLDKWNGFFPVKWHVVKDIPNNQLRHIILENNERKPVTFSRDTQEIPLKQGLEMLKIFKSYPDKSSLIDDFNFYENREKAKKSNKLATLRMEEEEEEHTNGDFAKNSEVGDEDDSGAKKITSPSCIINLTRNLSLNRCNQKSDSVKKEVEN